MVLILGGADKGSDFKELALVIKEKAKFAILFEGLGSDRIYKELENVGYDRNKIKFVSNMKEAVSIAFEHASSGEPILLSPACASFGVFKNYKERGDLFRGEVLDFRF